MTSPSFKIGLVGAEKNSSRVLRSPRHHTHSDIFGVRDNQNDERAIPNKRRYQPQSTISSCFTMVEEPAIPNKRRYQPQSTICSCFTMVEEPKVNEVIANGDQIIEEEKTVVDNGIDENKANNNMTSPSFKIVLTGAERNSSRVLKSPCHHTHSDIFGVRDNQNDERAIPNKRRYQPQSTISSCFTMVEEPAIPNKRRYQPQSTISSCFTMVEEPKVNEIIANGDQIIEEEKTEVDNGIDENKAPGVETEEKQPLKKEKEIIPSPRRGCVPPGRYSSGLW